MKMFDLSPNKKCRNCKRVFRKDEDKWWLGNYVYCVKSECYAAMEKLRVELRKKSEMRLKAIQKRKAKLIKQLERKKLCVFESGNYGNHLCFFCAEPVTDAKFCKVHNNIICYWGSCEKKAVFGHVHGCNHAACEEHKLYMCPCQPEL